MDQESEEGVSIRQRVASFGLPTEIADEIEMCSTPVTFERGSVFLRGSSTDLVFFLLKGFVKLYFPVNDGDRLLVDLARPGDILGFLEDVDSLGRRHLLEARALTRCSVGLLSRDRIIQLLSKMEREELLALLERINASWSLLYKRCLTFLASSFRPRLEMILRDLAGRFGADDARGTLIMVELTHDDLAEMIGSSRGIVSKLIAEMSAEGLLTREEKRHLILRGKGWGSAVSRADWTPPGPTGRSKRNLGRNGLTAAGIRPMS